MRSFINNPAFESVVNTSYRRSFELKNKTETFAIRVMKYVDMLRMPRQYIRPAFVTSQRGGDDPFWAMPKTEINIFLSECKKNVTIPHVYRSEYRRVLSEVYSEWFIVHTDGSKSEEGVGAAAVTSTTVRTASLPVCASIFTAELYAISMALDLINDRNESRTVIFCDSMSVLQIFVSDDNRNSLALKIRNGINNMRKTGKTVELCWIPGHVGIAGNEKADHHAKLASLRAPELILLPYTDMYCVITEGLKDIWQDEWHNSGNKLLLIRDDVSKIPSNANFNRKDEVVCNRLRVGHTLLTHGYLMERDRDIQGIPQPCELCMNHVMSVKHVLVDCEVLRLVRRNVLGKERVTMKELLGGKVAVKTMQFIKAIGMYHRV